MRAWLRRFLGLPPYPDHEPAAKQAIELRVAELEQHVDWLHGALRKLRGMVTGGLRGDPEPLETKGSGGVDGPQARGNPQAIELLKKRGRM